MTRQTVKNALEKIGVTDGQKQVEFFSAFADKKLALISEKDVSAVLNRLGVTDKKTLGDFFAALREPEIMDQELDIDELDAVAGGDACDAKDEDTSNCVQQHNRPLLVYGKKNCAATVGMDDAAGLVDFDMMCSTNDACNMWAVQYY